MERWIKQIEPILLSQDRFVLLETQRFDQDNYLSYLFLNPITIITCFNLDAVSEAFVKLEAFLDEGYWAAGFFSYEMGYAWEDFEIKKRFPFPLIWLGIFKTPLIFNHRKGRILDIPPSQNFWPGGRYRIEGIRLNEKLSEYVRNIQRIKDYIARGLTYQVNYTIKCKFKFQGSSFSLYKDLRNTQPVSYAAFIKDRQFSLLSFSPELFFRKKGRIITVRPMKGTISRGRTEQEDKIQIKRLKQSLKDRSENVMIVDLLRNDLGRVSQAGSVRVAKLYTVERYKTLFQMTSTIQAKLKSNLSLYELFKSIFPSGSVTGAPKIKTMQIIRQLEKQERRVYTGAIGFFKPDRDAVFNVAIRTLLLEGGCGEMGIGSGIVYDSESQKEYKECQLKALFFTPLDKHKRQDEQHYLTGFTKKTSEFPLIETMRWSKRTGFFLLSYHLDRLKSSAAYFNFSFNQEEIKQRLKRISRYLNPDFAYPVRPKHPRGKIKVRSNGAYRVRLLLSERGEVDLSYRRIKVSRKSTQPRITFAKARTNSQDIFLYHKTTNRRLYDEEYRRAKRAGFFEVIFENERSEITEGAISNIFIRKGKMYYTPPVNCGLLCGVYRRYFIRKQAPFVRQKILKRQDLYEADAIYLTNAVRGITRVRL